MAQAAIDMEKICRICMRQDLELFLIFDEKYALDKMNLADMLTECTMYKVMRYDELPHQICASCLGRTQQAYSFKRDCEQAYRKLIEMLVLTTEDGSNVTSSVIKQEANAVISAEKCTQTEDSTMYPCERCEQKFFTFDALRAHRENAHKGSAIVCRFCGKAFNRVGYLRTHIAVFHPESGYTSHNQCNICKRQFTRREHMRRHLAVIHKIVEMVDAQEDMEEDEQKTDEENQEMAATKSDTLELEQDVQQMQQDNLEATTNEQSEFDEPTHTDYSEDEEAEDDVKPTAINSDEEDEKPLAEFTRKNFVEVLIDESISAVQHNDKPNDYAHCIKYELAHGSPIEPPEVDVLETETKTLPAVETSTKPFACNSCSKRFTRAVCLKNHQNNVHDNVKPKPLPELLRCDECDLQFTHSTQLKRHIDSKHSRKTHKCDVCNKTFTTKMYLQRHMLVHSKKRYSCKECSESFDTKEELQTHIKAESHDKPLLCPECGLRCKTSNILMVHMRRHKGEKPFKCKFCSKGFPRMDDLRIHERYHTGEKSHFCETCGKGFQRKYNLTIHMRVHTGEKPYKCPHCPHAFTQSNDLKSHIRRHTGERFRCNICSAPFLQGYQMRQHKLTEHGVKEEPPTQRVEKYRSAEEQELQIKQNLQRELAKSMCSSSEQPEVSLSELIPAVTIDENNTIQISFLNI